MTYEIDVALGKNMVRTPFGIHGLSYGANVQKPINIEGVISKVVGAFRLSEGYIHREDMSRVYMDLANVYTKTVTRLFKSRNLYYIGSDLSWIADEDTRINLEIVQRLLLLLGYAAIHGYSVIFR